MGKAKISSSSTAKLRICELLLLATRHALTHLTCPCRRAEYIPPKRPYSFEAMLNDILDFAALSLVDNGRVSFWMPTANDEDVKLGIPTHSWLEIVSCCVQVFTKCKSASVPLGFLLLTITRVAKTIDLSKTTGSGSEGGRTSSSKRRDEWCYG